MLISAVAKWYKSFNKSLRPERRGSERAVGEKGRGGWIKGADGFRKLSLLENAFILPDLVAVASFLYFYFIIFSSVFNSWALYLLLNWNKIKINKGSDGTHLAYTQILHGAVPYVECWKFNGFCLVPDAIESTRSVHNFLSYPCRQTHRQTHRETNGKSHITSL